MTVYKTSDYLLKSGRAFGPLGWNDDNLGDSVQWTFKHFYLHFMQDEDAPYISSKRGVKEKWDMFHLMGFATKINKDVSRFDVAKIREYLKDKGAA